MPHRPLSPHLQVYKPQLTSVLSILHRGTGVIIAIGAVAVAMLFWSIALGADAYRCMIAFFTSLTGKGMLIIWTSAAGYHLFNGIRHLFWDFGYGFDLARTYLSGWLVVIATVLFTAAVWLI